MRITAQTTGFGHPRQPIQLKAASRRRRAARTLAVLACTVALASCSQPSGGSDPQPSGAADPDNATHSSEASPAASPGASPAAGTGATSGATSPGQTGAADPQTLVDPLETRSGVRVGAGSEEVLLSEQGAGTNSYPLGISLVPGQKVMVTASCPEGERVIIESDAGLLWADLVCGNPAVSSYTSPPAGEAAADQEIRVSTTGDSPYWLLVTVQDPPQ